MTASKAHSIGRRQFLGAGVAALAESTLSPQPAWASPTTIFKSNSLEALVLSDGHFVLPMDFLVAPDAPPVEREAALKSAGQGGNQLQLVNNVCVIRSPSGVLLVDAGAGPRHQPTAGKLLHNLIAAGIEPSPVTWVVLTHGTDRG